MRISAEEMIKNIPDYKPETIQALRKWLGENPHYPPTSGESPSGHVMWQTPSAESRVSTSGLSRCHGGIHRLQRKTLSRAE